MATSFFDKTKTPDETALSEALGESKPCWDALLAQLEAECDGLGREWKFYGGKYGWQLKVLCKKRAILYLVPHENGFLAALALNEKGVEALRGSGLPPSLIESVATAKAYPEGRPARVEVTNVEEAAIVRQLVAIKRAS